MISLIINLIVNIRSITHFNVVVIAGPYYRVNATYFVEKENVSLIFNPSLKIDKFYWH